MTDLGITYEEANPPEPYCKRCGKKLGTEAYDVHTCTPKEIQPVGRFAKFSDGIWKEVTDGSAGQPLYTAPPQREWVGLTDDDVEYAIAAIYKGFDINPRNQIEIDYLSRVIKTVEAKLKEKNT